MKGGRTDLWSTAISLKSFSFNCIFFQIDFGIGARKRTAFVRITDAYVDLEDFLALCFFESGNMIV